MPVHVYQNLEITGVGRVFKVRNTRVRELTMRDKVSPKFSFGMDEGRAHSEYAIEWSSARVGPGPGPSLAFQAGRDFLGYSNTAKDLSGNVTGIQRIIPYPHPTSPNYLYAVSVPNIEGWVPLGQDGSKISIYDEAKVTVDFSTRSFKIKDDGTADESILSQYVTIIPTTTGRMERIPQGSALVWTGTNISVANTGAVTFCEGEVDIIWHQIPVEAIPWNAIATCVGCCDGASAGGGNEKTFLKNTYIGPVFQTLREATGQRFVPVFVCLSPKISKPYPMISGNSPDETNYAVDINYKFKFYPFGANNFYRWDVAQFRPASRQGTNIGFYREANFNTLFYGT